VQKLEDPSYIAEQYSFDLLMEDLADCLTAAVDKIADNHYRYMKIGVAVAVVEAVGVSVAFAAVVDLVYQCFY
jgi:hypothetical protein